MDNTWIKIIADNAPPPRSGHCCALLDNDFYVFGGLNQTEVMNDFYQFNLIEKKWIKIKNINHPPPRSAAQLCASTEDKKLYLFGGTTLIVEKICKNDLYQFDIQTQQWTIISNLSTTQPNERYGHSMSYNNYSLYLFGGVKFTKAQNRMNPEFLNDFWVFQLINKLWIKLELRGQIQPQPRYRHTTIFVNNQLYIVGGTTNQSRFGQIIKGDLEELTWQSLELEAIKNKTKKNLFKGRYGHACIAIDNHIYIYGGNDDGLCDDALQLNVEANLWGKKRFLGEIIARDFFGYAQSQNQLILFGGKTQQNMKLNDILIWNHDLKQNEQIYCTLKSEMFQLLSLQSNCSNLLVNSNNSQICLHHSFVNIRCKQFILQNQKISETLLQCLVQYIYKATIEYELLVKLQIRETIQLMIHISDHNFILYILSYMLQQCQTASDFEYLEKELIPYQQIEIIKEVMGIISQRKQKQQPNIPLFKQTNKIFNNLQAKIHNQYYQDLKTLQNDKQSSDILLIVGCTEFHVHSYILVARCEFFRALVRFEEGIIQKINLEDINPQVMQVVINYLYQGYQALQKNQQNSLEVLTELYKVTNYLMLNNQTFMYLLQEGMSQYISMDNVLQIVEMAEKLNAAYLLRQCCNFIVDNMKQFQEDTLLNFPKEILVKILRQMGDKYSQ